MLDVVGDVHAETAARLIRDADTRDGPARELKLMAAITHLEGAYTAFDSALRRGNSPWRVVLRSQLDWTTAMDEQPVQLASAKAQVALFLALAYHGLGEDAMSVDQWLSRARDATDGLEIELRLREAHARAGSGSWLFRLRSLMTSGPKGLQNHDAAWREQTVAQIRDAKSALGDARTLVHSPR
jgi:hypothetical protein